MNCESIINLFSSNFLINVMIDGQKLFDQSVKNDMRI